MRNYDEKNFEGFIEEYLIAQNHYLKRDSKDYDKALCLDSESLFAFLQHTQEKEIDEVKKRVGEDYHKAIIERISKQIKEQGILKSLKSGIEIRGVKIKLAYPKPSSDGNDAFLAHYERNTLALIRQLYYSQSNQKSLDMVILLNGIPIITIELKNKLTGQSLEDAIKQYKNDRDPREPLFDRCIVHFAVDNDSIAMSTKLQKEQTQFLPFNRGLNDGSGEIGRECGAGNPNGEELKSSYLWEKILKKDFLLSLIFNFVQRMEDGRVIFPRYHQLDVVSKLLADVKENGVGKRYLIQHSAGSGKSNSISWLAHQLASLHRRNDEGKMEVVFHSVIVVTDRRVLDAQIQKNIEQFSEIRGVVESITQGSTQLKDALERGKKIIVTTIQKFPYIADEISQMGERRFAIIIDEAHSSQGGNSAQKLNEAIGGGKIHTSQADETIDTQDALTQIIKSKKFQPNASYFAFTATPKPKTLEAFGLPCLVDGVEKYIPFHLYPMKQAIEEGFILDVLRGYTTYQSYYKITASTEENPLFDKKKANSKIKRYVESHPDTIDIKARIMIDHFCSNIYKKIGGKAKAMVVTSSRENAVKYFFAFKTYLRKIDSPYRALVAFSGEVMLNGETHTESGLNGISESRLREEFKQAKYRFLIVAEKYQTGFDEPLLHTMYVDKKLSGVSAVQTLSRLNRTHRGKDNTCVIDFVNTHEEIGEAFSAFYEQTFLGEGTDIDQIFDLKSNLNTYGIYTQEEVDDFARAILKGERENIIHPKLDWIVHRYNARSEDERLSFYRNAKNYVRDYGFLAQILPFEDEELEKLSILLKMLLSKLALPKGEDLARGIIDAIDLESYRVQLIKSADIVLEGNGELMGSQADGTSKMPESELEELLKIIQEYNEKHGDGIQWGENDKVATTLMQIKDDVLRDEEFKKSVYKADTQNMRIEFENMLNKKFKEDILMANFALFKQFNDDEEFKNKITQKMFDIVRRELLKDEGNHLGI